MNKSSRRLEIDHEIRLRGLGYDKPHVYRNCGRWAVAYWRQMLVTSYRCVDYFDSFDEVCKFIRTEEDIVYERR